MKRMIVTQKEMFSNMYIFNNEVFLRVTNHTGQAEKNLETKNPAGIRFTSPML